MFPGFIAKKVGMTQVFEEDGSAVAVTVLALEELTVTQVKTLEKDGYTAVQVGYQPAKEKHLSRPEKGHFAKRGLPLYRHLKEFRLDAAQVAQLQVGQALDSSVVLQPGVRLKITGRSIGKGTQGGIRRWGHHRGPMTHGSKSHRLPGSIGAGTTPGRVFKGLQMAGRMGAKSVTTRNLRVVAFLPEEKLVLVKGSVPGVEGSYVSAVQEAGR